MEIWILWFWSATAKPFEGGQYRSEEYCQVRAVDIAKRLRPEYGRLKWKCELWQGQG